MKYAYTRLVCACTPISDAPPLLSQAEGRGRDAFFDVMSTGDYDRLDDAIETLTQEYLDGDPLSTATLGFAHAYRLSEAGRVDDAPARVIESADLAVRYFSEAHELLPGDPRIEGFAGAFKMAAGSIHGDQPLQKEGWFDAKRAATSWPQWGLFTRAYVLTGLDSSSNRFQKSIDFYYENVDVCAGEKLDRDAFDYRPYMPAVQSHSDPLIRRACGNTDVAPFNTEGFFLAFGDTLAKSGDLSAAKNMYEHGLDVPNDQGWVYESLALKRLADLDQLPTWFNEAIDPEQDADLARTTAFEGPYNCSICHQLTP